MGLGGGGGFEWNKNERKGIEGLAAVKKKFSLRYKHVLLHSSSMQ